LIFSDESEDLKITVDTGSFRHKKTKIRFDMKTNENLEELFSDLLKSELFSFSLIEEKYSESSIAFAAKSKFSLSECALGMISRYAERTLLTWWRTDGKCVVPPNLPYYEVGAVSEEELQRAFSVGVHYSDVNEEAPFLDTFGYLKDLDVYTNLLSDQAEKKKLLR